jgi:hypothetical protein
MKQLIFPPLLVELMNTGRWKQPSDEKIKLVIPFLQEPVDFLFDVDKIRRESSGVLADMPDMSEFFHEYRGSKTSEKDLPWLDVDRALFIAVNRVAGADIAIALDYRTDVNDPRVVASDWWSVDKTHFWREAESRFSDFVKRLGI